MEVFVYEEDEEQDDLTSKTELKESLKKIKETKSLGYDNLPTELIKGEEEYLKYIILKDHK